MNQTSLIEALAKRVLVCDGAMGTQLMAAGLEARPREGGAREEPHHHRRRRGRRVGRIQLFSDW